jgi:type II secretory pathway pseudopilin PulG
MGSPRAQRGYVLLTLLLGVSLMVMAAAAIAPSIAFQIKRDREEEFIHRGVQYSRAIRLYAKKNGRYPLRLEELSDANGQKFIRKLYKDPITGRDFKLLHTADIMKATAGVNPINSQPGIGAVKDGTGSDPDQAAVEAGQDAENAGNQNPQAGVASANGNSTSPNAASATASTFVRDDPTTGVIFGVASTSKGKTIREFNHKNHYNEWLFFYDQNHDQGRLITGPTSPALPTASPMGQPAAGSSQTPTAPVAAQQ